MIVGEEETADQRESLCNRGYGNNLVLHANFDEQTGPHQGNKSPNYNGQDSLPTRRVWIVLGVVPDFDDPKTDMIHGSRFTHNRSSQNIHVHSRQELGHMVAPGVVHFDALMFHPLQVLMVAADPVHSDFWVILHCIVCGALMQPAVALEMAGPGRPPTFMKAHFVLIIACELNQQTAEQH